VVESIGDDINLSRMDQFAFEPQLFGVEMLELEAPVVHPAMRIMMMKVGLEEFDDLYFCFK
jgi:hypothetical protein